MQKFPVGEGRFANVLQQRGEADIDELTLCSGKIFVVYWPLNNGFIKAFPCSLLSRVSYFSFPDPLTTLPIHDII